MPKPVLAAALMPWHPGQHEGPSHYVEPTHISGAAYEAAGIDFLLARKKERTRFREEMLAAQRACGRGDREGARFFGREAAQAMKEYRACCYILSVAMADPPGDCRGVQASLELAPYIDFAFALADLALYPLDAVP